MRSERLVSASIALVSRALLARDALTGRARKLRKDPSREDFFFASGSRKLAGVYVAGEAGAPVILLCHGIGETVEHWSVVQAFLHELGVGSLVFNYSGYGKSSGRICVENCDEDLLSGYAELRRRVGVEARVFVLGFSMGSGIAATGIRRIEPAPDGLFLCEAFTSFREAARAAWTPAWIVRTFADTWNTVEAVRGLDVPVCVVHSDGDGLFPLTMARRIADASGGELVVVSGLSHNEPYLRPTAAYWGPIVERAMSGFVASNMTEVAR